MRKIFAAIAITAALLIFPTTILAANIVPPPGGGGGGSIGTITPPDTVPNPGGDPSGFIAGIIRGIISILLIVAFIIGVIWTIFAGFRFIFAGGDEKAITAAWSQIYWGLLGLVIVVGSFAIIKLVETFFQVNIISGGFALPQR